MIVEGDTDTRLAERVDGAGAVVTRWLRRLMVSAVLVGGGYQVVRQWSEVSYALGSLSPLVMVLSLLAVFGGVLLAPLMWHTVLGGIGPPIRFKEASVIYLVGQLGKYLPGSLWAFAVQAELGRTAGVSRSRAFITSVITFGLIIVSALLMGIPAMPAILAGHREYLWAFLPLPLGLIMLHPRPLTWIVSLGLRILRRPPLGAPLRGMSIVKATGVGLLTFVFFGVHLWLLASSLGPLGPGGLVLCVGTISFGVAAGMLAFVLPSGIGIREVVIVAALVPVLPAGQALTVAVVSRLMFTVVDLMSAGGAALVARVHWRLTRTLS